MPGLRGNHKQPDWEPCQCKELQGGLPEGVFKETQRHPPWRSSHCMSGRGANPLPAKGCALFPQPYTWNALTQDRELRPSSWNATDQVPQLSAAQRAGPCREPPAQGRASWGDQHPMADRHGRTKLWSLASTGQLGRVIPASKLWGQLRPHQDSITAQLYLLPAPPFLFSSASPSSPFPFLFHRWRWHGFVQRQVEQLVQGELTGADGVWLTP